jgi:hypothetical protein
LVRAALFIKQTVREAFFLALVFPYFVKSDDFHARDGAALIRRRGNEALNPLDGAFSRPLSTFPIIRRMRRTSSKRACAASSRDSVTAVFLTVRLTKVCTGTRVNKQDVDFSKFQLEKKNR